MNQRRRPPYDEEDDPCDPFNDDTLLHVVLVLGIIACGILIIWWDIL